MDFRERIEQDENALQKLVSKLPGFGGYFEREKRRAADKLLREHLCEQVDEAVEDLEKVSSQWSHAGKLDELDDLENTYFSDGKADDDLEHYKQTGLYEYVHMMKPPDEPEAHVPFNLMVKLARVAPRGAEEGFIRAKLEEYQYLRETSKGVDERIRRAINWVQDFQEDEPEKVTLDGVQRGAVQAVIDGLRKAGDVDAYQAVIFDVSKAMNLKPRSIFTLVYQILIGRPQGPRFGPYVELVGKESVIKELERSLKY